MASRYRIIKGDLPELEEGAPEEDSHTSLENNPSLDGTKDSSQSPEYLEGIQEIIPNPDSLFGSSPYLVVDPSETLTMTVSNGDAFQIRDAGEFVSPYTIEDCATREYVQDQIKELKNEFRDHKSGFERLSNWIGIGIVLFAATILVGYLIIEKLF